MTIRMSKDGLLAILVLAAAANFTFVHNAKAEDFDHRMEPERHAPVVVHDRYWERHEMEARHWHRYHPQPEPHVVYAPPPVVYAPPPPPPGINLIIPLDLR